MFLKLFINFSRFFSDFMLSDSFAIKEKLFSFLKERKSEHRDIKLYLVKSPLNTILKSVKYFEKLTLKF